MILVQTFQMLVSKKQELANSRITVTSTAVILEYICGMLNRSVVSSCLIYAASSVFADDKVELQ